MKITKFLGIFLFSLVALTFVFTKDSYAANSKTMTKSTAWNRAEIRWQAVANADHYNIYYSEGKQMKFIGAVRDIKAMPGWNMQWINHLRPGVKYFYRIAAADGNGVEFWWSSEMMMKTQSMPKAMAWSDMEPSR